MNFVFFFPDEMSASTVSCYGHPHVQMPNYDRIAGEGVRFDQCIVQNPVCSPSRCCLFTGTYPHNRGHRTLWHLLRPDEPSMFRYLKEAGYDIAWYGKNDLYSREYLDEVCCDIAEKRAAQFNPIGKNSRKNAFELGDEGYYSFLFEPGQGEPGQEGVPVDPPIRQAIDFLQNRKPGDRPFFLYLPTSLPHPPYTVFEKFYNLYDPDQVGKDLFPQAQGKPEYERYIRQYRNLDNLPESVLKKINAVYLGMNSYVDAMLGLLDRTLEQTGLAEDTVLIISSDHGDWHGLRRLVEKWPNAMDDELVRVPLMIRAPGGKRGHVVTEQVEMFDIMPTVLELAGIPCTHTHFAHSLVPQIQGAPGDPGRVAFCEGGYDTHEPNCSEWYSGRTTGLEVPGNIYYPKMLQQHEQPQTVCRTVMARTSEYKLVRRTSGDNEFYHLSQDPGELHNLYGDPAYAAQKAELETVLLDWYLKTSDTVPYGDDDRNFGTP